MALLAESPKDWPLLKPGTLIRIVAALIFETMVHLRLLAYKHGWLKTEHPNVPVIAVGNLNVGGAGKTPMVDYLAKRLQPARPALLSRGYKRKGTSTVQRFRACEQQPLSPDILGDEPFMLAQKNPNLPVYVSVSRKLASRIAVTWDHPGCLLLDDAFQHLALKRDLNLLLIDASQGLGNRYLMPAGPLREPENQWKRADAILLTKSNLGFTDAILHQLKHELKITCPIFCFDYLPEGLFKLHGGDFMPLNPDAGPIFLSSGIAHPHSFRMLFEQRGFSIVGELHHQDHQEYTLDIVQSLKHHFSKSEATCWITTEKDGVKLTRFADQLEDLQILRMQIHPREGWEPFFLKFTERYGLQSS